MVLVRVLVMLPCYICVISEVFINKVADSFVRFFREIEPSQPNSDNSSISDNQLENVTFGHTYIEIFFFLIYFNPCASFFLVVPAHQQFQKAAVRPEDEAQVNVLAPVSS